MGRSQKGEEMTVLEIISTLYYVTFMALLIGLVIAVTRLHHKVDAVENRVRAIYTVIMESERDRLTKK